MVEIEIRELLSNLGYDSDETPVLYGSALLALQGDQSEYGEPAVRKLLTELDKIDVSCDRIINAPFLMPVDSGVTVRGRGTVVVGTIKQGLVEKNMAAELIGYDEIFKTSVSEIHIFKQSVPKVRY